MKKVFLLMCVVCMLFICTLSVNAADEIKVMVDERTVEFDQPPVLMNDRTSVPVRAIFEKLGAKVDWNSETRTVTATKDDITISLQIDNEEMNANSDGQSKKVTLDQPPVIINNRTLVPVRAISEAFGAGVEWWPNTKTVAIDSDGVYESKARCFRDGKLYFNMEGSSGTEMERNIFIWDGNNTATIPSNGIPHGYIVKDGYIFYTSSSSLNRVKTDGTEHRVLQRDINYTYTSRLENRCFIKDSKIYYIAEYNDNLVLASVNINGGDFRELEVIKDYSGQVLDVFSNYGNIYILFGNGELNKNRVYNTSSLYKVSLSDMSVINIGTYENTFTYVRESYGRVIPEYENVLDRDVLEATNKYSNLGETKNWKYFIDNYRLYRQNNAGDIEFVCSAKNIKECLDIIEIFEDFIYFSRESLLYTYTDTYTVEVMDLDGLNPKTIYSFSRNSNFNANSNITDLSATGMPQDCGICGGAGRVECMTCDGSGKVRDYSYSVSSLRDDDGNERYRHCSFCNGGMKNCLGCGGDGRIHD